jgi:hypothetical protein
MDLEIAPNDISAPNAFGVETSDDVINGSFIHSDGITSSFFESAMQRRNCVVVAPPQALRLKTLIALKKRIAVALPSRSISSNGAGAKSETWKAC